MRTVLVAAQALLLLLAPLQSSAQTLRQSVKYTLLIVAGGMNDGGRNGSAMTGTGIYMGREECEAAGAGVKFGVVSAGENQPPPTIVWVCVPLGKP